MQDTKIQETCTQVFKALQVSQAELSKEGETLFTMSIFRIAQRGLRTLLRCSDLSEEDRRVITGLQEVCEKIRATLLPAPIPPKVLKNLSPSAQGVVLQNGWNFS